jgi:hypothetical protein
MDLANVSCNSQDSQLLALVLLENAQLTPDILQGAKLQLVQQAQQRVWRGIDQSPSAHMQCIEKCTQMLSMLSVAVPERFPESDVIAGDPVTLSMR